MEPLITVATAVVASVMTKFWEKTGEKIAEKTFTASDIFLQSLRQKAPKTYNAIEKAPESPLDYSQVLLEVEALTKTDPEVLEAVQILAIAANQDSNSQLSELIRIVLNTLQNQQPTVQNLSKVAEEIEKSFINQGFIQHQTITFH